MSFFSPTLLSNSRSSSHRSGITLIEVIASVMLMSVLLVGILLSFGRHQEQLTLAGEKQRAIVAMDLLLNDWFSNADRFPVDASGICQGDEDLGWSSRRVKWIEFGKKVDASAIRVEIFLKSEPTRSLVTVELLDRPPSIREGVANAR